MIARLQAMRAQESAQRKIKEDEDRERAKAEAAERSAKDQANKTPEQLVAEKKQEEQAKLYRQLDQSEKNAPSDLSIQFYKCKESFEALEKDVNNQAGLEEKNRGGYRDLLDYQNLQNMNLSMEKVTKTFGGAQLAIISFFNNDELASLMKNAPEIGRFAQKEQDHRFALISKLLPTLENEITETRNFLNIVKNSSNIQSDMNKQPHNENILEAEKKATPFIQGLLAKRKEMNSAHDCSTTAALKTTGKTSDRTFDKDEEQTHVSGMGQRR